MNMKKQVVRMGISYQHMAPVKHAGYAVSLTKEGSTQFQKELEGSDARQAPNTSYCGIGGLARL